MFPKCADEKIGTVFESDVVIPPGCRCLNMLWCEQEEECRRFCHRYCDLGAHKYYEAAVSNTKEGAVTLHLLYCDSTVGLFGINICDISVL